MIFFHNFDAMLFQTKTGKLKKTALSVNKISLVYDRLIIH